MATEKKEALIYGRISKIMSEIGAIGKDKKNLQQNYQFRGIDDMYNALNKHLADQKVFFTSEIKNVIREERISKQGGVLVYSILTIKWKIYTDDGSFIETETMGEAMDSGDKSMNKAMSTAYKYAFMQIFCIPTEEEKDTEFQSHDLKPTKSPTKKTDKPEAPKPAVTEENIKNFFDQVEKGKIKVASQEEAVLKISQKYTLTKDDEVKIIEAFNSIKF